MYVYIYIFVYIHTYVMKDRPNFEDALQGSAVLNERTMKFRGCSARERDFRLNFQDAPHGSAIFV